MPHHEPPGHHRDFCHPRGAGNVEVMPSITAPERDLVLYLLRRYVTWCVRSGRLPAAEGARVLAKRVGRAHVTLDEQPGPDRIGPDTDSRRDRRMPPLSPGGDRRPPRRR